LEERVKKLGSIEDRVVQLESVVKSANETPSGQSEFEKKILGLVSSWKEDHDERWSGMQEDWDTERKRINDAKEEFERRTNGLEEGLGSVKLRVESIHVQTVAAATFAGTNGTARGEIRHGLVTPPSPRSVSVDSQRIRRPRTKVKRPPSRDSLSDSDAPMRTKPLFNAVGVGVGIEVKTEPGEEDSPPRSSKRGSTRSDASSTPSSTAFEDDLQDMLSRTGKLHVTPLTPESSILREKKPPPSSTTEPRPGTYQKIEINPSTLLGCVIVGAAAAAVYWRTHE